MNETEQRYHSNKQDFLALKWAVTEQFHEYLSPYGKNRNEFVIRTDNNPLTYIFSSANLDAAGQRWVAQLASYNFALEYQKGKDNIVANFLSRLDDRLPTGEVQDYLNKIPYPGVKAVLDNAITPLTDRAEQGVRPNPNNQKAGQEVTIGARPARLATTNITDWKLEQQEDPVLYQVVKHRKASRETFKEALLKVTDRKAVSAEAAVEDEGPSGPLPSLLTRQEGDMTSQVWLNGEFRTKPWTQMMSRVPESPPDKPGDEVSDLESGMSNSESEGT